MMAITLNIRNVTLDVTYWANPYKAATFLDPEEPIEVDFESILCNGVDVSDLLSEKVIREIINRILDVEEKFGL